MKSKITTKKLSIAANGTLKYTVLCSWCCVQPCCLADGHAGKCSSLYCWRSAPSRLPDFRRSIFAKTYWFLAKNHVSSTSFFLLMWRFVVTSLHLCVILSFILNVLTGSAGIIICLSWLCAFGLFSLKVFTGIFSVIISLILSKVDGSREVFKLGGIMRVY